MKESRPPKDPLFLRFVNKDISIEEMLVSFSKSSDPYTAKTALGMIENPPFLEDFCAELTEAVSDLIEKGLDEEFKAFVDHYMKESLEERVIKSEGQFGENVTRLAMIRDEKAPWIQGFICYNLCLYIRTFGLDDLKKCRTCSKIFCHKGRYAVYCSNGCKSAGIKRASDI
jgi:hypothetical protein